ncbi:MAG: radical SAM protein [Candidatus Omnitrophota bacterium]
MSHRIDIKVGYSCNNHCIFCVQGDKRSRIGDKSHKEVLSILEKRRRDNNEVVFTGGEVTIRDDFFVLLRRAAKLRYDVIQVQSNGRMFAYEEFCEKAVKAGANSFALALHGSTKKVHDLLTRVPGSFDQTVRGIGNLKKLKQKVLLNTVVTKANYKDLPRIAELLVSMSVDQFQFAFVHICDTLAGNRGLVKEIVARKSMVEKYVKKGLQTGIDSNIPVMAEALPYCFMKGYEQYISDRFIPPTSIEETFFTENYEKARKEEDKIKGPRCAACASNDVCEGPWKEYPAIFGWEEFKPV